MLRPQPPRPCPLIGQSPTWEMCARQLASWAKLDEKPMCPPLLRELKRLGIASEFVFEQPHTFITVRLPKGPLTPPITSIYDKTSSMSYSWLEDAHVVYEGWTRDNPHLHLLTKGIHKKQNIIRCFSVRYNVAPQMVDVAQSTDGQLYLRRRHQYIMGNKVPEKMDAVLEDRVYREEQSIPHLHSLFC